MDKRFKYPRVAGNNEVVIPKRGAFKKRKIRDRGASSVDVGELKAMMMRAKTLYQSAQYTEVNAHMATRAAREEWQACRKRYNEVRKSK